MIIHLMRNTYFTDCTMGELLINDKHFGYTLEDVVRADKIKIKGETAIPSGFYRVSVSMSSRFKKEMIEIHNVPMFKGIRIHGGNDDDDTEGCPLLGKNISGNKIWDCSEVNNLLVNLVKEEEEKGEVTYIHIINLSKTH